MQILQAPQKPGDVLDTVHVVLDSPLPVNRLARDLPLVATLRPFAPMAGESPGFYFYYKLNFIYFFRMILILLMFQKSIKISKTEIVKF